ncbi:MAG: hypothetical protein O7E52_10640 [Candidatus Poribacteria bacterium]|nr:hypothetical protein [Candidatus Poribacteria bacterium]
MLQLKVALGVQLFVSHQKSLCSYKPTVSAFTLDNRRFGVIICADNGNRAIYDLLYESGARIFLAPNAGAIKKFEGPGNSWEALIKWHRKHRLLRHRQIAQTYGVTNVYFDLKDPRDNFADLPDWIHYVSGKSAVFGSDGEWMASNAGNEECLVVADV